MLITNSIRNLQIIEWLILVHKWTGRGTWSPHKAFIFCSVKTTTNEFAFTSGGCVHAGKGLGEETLIIILP